MSERGGAPVAEPTVAGNPEEWQHDAGREAKSHEGSRPHEARPELPADELIDEGSADRIEKTQEEREQELTEARRIAKETSQKEVAERLGLDQGGLKSFMGRIKEWFVGEYSDIEKADNLADLEPEKQAEALEKAWKITSREYWVDAAKRTTKVFGKTAITGGLGAVVTAALGGTVGSPVFLGALAGGAIFRGGVEILRKMNGKERGARVETVAARADVLREAARIESHAQQLFDAREAAETDQEREEIQQEIDDLYQHFIKLTNYKSYEQLEGAQPESEDQALEASMAKVRELGTDKTKLEHKREKLADVVAAVGNVLGGLSAPTIQSLLVGQPSPEAVSGFMADFDNEEILKETHHFVEKITPEQIKSADAGFIDQLKASGGYVFRFTSNEVAQGVPDVVTSAFTKTGEHIHVLSGMTDELFNHHLSQVANPEIAQRATELAGNFWKEAVPQAAANLLFLLSRTVPNSLSGRKSKEGQIQEIAPRQESATTAPEEPEQQTVEPVQVGDSLVNPKPTQTRTEQERPQDDTKYKVGQPFYFGQEWYTISDVDTSGEQPIYTLTQPYPHNERDTVTPGADEGELFSIKKVESRLDEAAKRSQERLNAMNNRTKKEVRGGDGKSAVPDNNVDQELIGAYKADSAEKSRETTTPRKKGVLEKVKGLFAREEEPVASDVKPDSKSAPRAKEVPVAESERSKTIGRWLDSLLSGKELPEEYSQEKRVSSAGYEAAFHAFETLWTNWQGLPEDKKSETKLEFSVPPADSSSERKLYIVTDTSTGEKWGVGEQNAERDDLPTTYQVYAYNEEEKIRPVEAPQKLAELFSKLRQSISSSATEQVPTEEPVPGYNVDIPVPVNGSLRTQTETSAESVTAGVSEGSSSKESHEDESDEESEADATSNNEEEAATPEPDKEEAYESMLAQYGLEPDYFAVDKELGFFDDSTGARGEMIKTIKDELDISGPINAAGLRVLRVEPEGADAIVYFGIGEKEVALPASTMLEMGLLKLPKK